VKLKTARLIVSLALVIFVSGCGSLEWKSDQYPTSSSTATNKVFSNATAVIVGAGDTVYALSRRHGVSQRDIIIANDLKAPYKLVIGQRIILPRGTVYTVVSGDTLGGIANTYRVDLYELARANNIRSPYTIYVDQQLRIPGTGTIPKTQTASAQTSSIPPTNSGTATTTTKTTQKVVQASVPPPPPTSGKGYVWPVDGKLLSSFGAKEGGLHNDGINIAAKEGSPVRAAENGVIAYAGNELRGFGNLLLIKHSNGYVTAYAHNATLLVNRGDKVKKGQDIATVGSTGNVSTPQLHFELRKGKKPLDPRKYLPSV
jgi:murein DD-endopeptidase MepM/ murein hydrolase activator NlpD